MSQCCRLIIVCCSSVLRILVPIIKSRYQSNFSCVGFLDLREDLANLDISLIVLSVIQNSLKIWLRVCMARQLPLRDKNLKHIFCDVYEYTEMIQVLCFRSGHDRSKCSLFSHLLPTATVWVDFIHNLATHSRSVEFCTQSFY